MFVCVWQWFPWGFHIRETPRSKIPHLLNWIPLFASSRAPRAMADFREPCLRSDYESKLSADNFYSFNWGWIHSSVKICVEIQRRGLWVNRALTGCFPLWYNSFVQVRRLECRPKQAVWHHLQEVLSVRPQSNSSADSILNRRKYRKWTNHAVRVGFCTKWQRCGGVMCSGENKQWMWYRMSHTLIDSWFLWSVWVSSVLSEL